MAVTMKRVYELFETRWAMQRQNPGGKSPYLQKCLLGFAGTINIMEVLDPVTKSGPIKLRIGNGAVQTRIVDFISVDPAHLTPSDAVLCLSSAGFSECTFSVDIETNRLKITPVNSDVRFLQIYSDVAGALNFGGCRSGEGKGCYLWASFDDDLKSVAETENWSEDTKITNESLLGSPINYTRAGKRTDTQVVITDRQASYAAKQMINGGKWIAGSATQPEVYEPPVSSDNDPRRVDLFTYSSVFDKTENTEGDELFIRERMYIGCVGHLTRTGGAGSWSDCEYTLTAATYIGDDGMERASPRETNYTQSQWETLQMDGVLVADWELA